MSDLSQAMWSSQMNNNPDAVVLDVRTAEEISEGIIPSAIHNDIYRGQDFIDDLEALDKEKHYYVYCRSGARSSQACAIMKQLGFVNVFNLLGGFLDWQGDTTFLN